MAASDNFVSHIKPPKLLIQGRYDERFALETHAKPLFELFRGPKQLLVVDWGHLPPLEARVSAINEFLDKTLGPVKFE